MVLKKPVLYHTNDLTQQSAWVWARICEIKLLFVYVNVTGWINLTKLRVPGVLQRFGVSYFVVGTTAVLFAKSSTALADNVSKGNPKLCAKITQ